MHTFEPLDPDYEQQVRKSFGMQNFMVTIGARLVGVRPGIVTIEMNHSEKLTQQHGYIHAGAITTLADNACGYAAYSLMPPNTEVLTVEFKVNFLAPSRGDKFVAIGRVLKPGRTLSVCVAEVTAHQNYEKKLVFTMQATMMCVQNNFY
ncbi:MAG: PaaI family thioesterase [Desulfomonilaceae bacterium]